MAQPNVYVIALARKFSEKFPIGTEVSRDEFDIWIIDSEMAEDPETDDTKSVAHKGFVQQRNAARKKLNNAASWLNGDSFQVVTGEEATDDYRVIAYADDSKSFVKQVGNKVEKYKRNRIIWFVAIKKIIKVIFDENPDDYEVEAALGMVQGMSIQGSKLQYKIKGLVAQYNVAADLIEAQAVTLLENIDAAAVAIEDNSENDA